MNNSEKEKILLSLAIEPDYSKDTLDLYLRKYPELTGEILDLAYEIEVINTPNISIGTDNISKALTLRGVFSGESLNRLSDRMLLPKDFLMGFRDSLVRIETIPSGFYEIWPLLWTQRYHKLSYF